MPRVGFEPTIPALERAKTVHALGRAATVIGLYTNLPGGNGVTLNYVLGYKQCGKLDSS
jgi:hypothetical protein